MDEILVEYEFTLPYGRGQLKTEVRHIRMELPDQEITSIQTDKGGKEYQAVEQIARRLTQMHGGWFKRIVFISRGLSREVPSKRDNERDVLSAKAEAFDLLREIIHGKEIKCPLGLHQGGAGSDRVE